MSGSFDQPQILVVYSDGSPCSDVDTARALAARGDRFRDIPEGKGGDRFRSESSPEQNPAAFPHAAHAAILGRGAVVSTDPHRIHRDFPVRWQTYVRANYRNLNHVQQVFGVSERTARSWWKGETGANGGYVAIAVNEHPIAAPRMLFAAE